MRERRDEVGIEAVEALRTESAATGNCGLVGTSRDDSRRERRSRRCIGHVGELEADSTDVARGAGRGAAGEVVVDLNDAILYPHGVVRAALVEAREETVAATNDGAGVWRPTEADAGLEAAGVLDAAGVLEGDGREVGVVLDRSRRDLDVIPEACGDVELRCDLPTVLDKAVEHLHPEVVETGLGSGVENIDGLDEACEVVAGVGVGVAGGAMEDVGGPVGEVDGV